MLSTFCCYPCMKNTPTLSSIAKLATLTCISFTSLKVCMYVQIFYFVRKNRDISRSRVLMGLLTVNAEYGNDLSYESNRKSSLEFSFVQRWKNLDCCLIVTLHFIEGIKVCPDGWFPFLIKFLFYLFVFIRYININNNKVCSRFSAFSANIIVKGFQMATSEMTQPRRIMKRGLLR